MINPYAMLDTFTPDEAIQAITGIVLPKTSEEKNQVTLFRKVLNNDIDSKNLKATVTTVQRVKKERLGMRRISIYDTRDHRPIENTYYTEQIISIARADLLAWCESKGIRPELLFPDQSAEKPLHDDSLTYHTPALDALRAAISQFWLHHDPSRPPKSPEIVGWLIKEHGMSKTMAESIDRIIRPEELRKGGNTKLP